MIEYKTYDEQLEILKQRNLIIEDEESAKKILRTNNYYNIVNRYKEIFVVNNGTSEERFVNGATFNDLYGLYKFDKKLKNLFFDYILDIENTIKSIIAHEFAKSYNSDEIIKYNTYEELRQAVMEKQFNNGCYFNFNNYDEQKKIVKRKSLNQRNGEMAENEEEAITAMDFIDELKSTLKLEVANNNKMIVHYLKQYQVVPIWVFVNCLTLGTISKMFYFLQDREQSAVCKSLSGLIGNEIYPKDLRAYLSLIVFVRNLCAHNNRLYDFRHYFTISKSNKFFQKLKIETQPKGLLALLVTLVNLMDIKSSNAMIASFTALLEELMEIKSIKYNVFVQNVALQGEWSGLYQIPKN